ncbi:MAG TPA: class I SAM-dependent methyltransferase [Bryobacteraceae bacterium]|nr:class I SAM-dependent methyltransferase [Bryobacteraceae bacterium]
MSVPDPAPVLDLIEAFRRSKTMFAAVSLGVFEALHESPADAATLAVRFGAERGALERLLDACVGMGMLAKRDGAYINQPVAETYLCDQSPLSLTGYVLYSNEALFPMWANLEDAIREGTHRWTQTFGWQGSLFDHFFKTDARRRSFLRGMHGFGQLSSPAVVAAFDLSRFRRLADLGGATGHLAIAACERYPQLSATVFDLPQVIAMAREYVAASPARDRIGCAAGDFFRDDLPEADLYSLGRILHDWPQDRIRLLLAKICEALPAGGALLIAEKLLDEDKSGPTPAHMQSLNMLVCTEGRERTLSEYATLLRGAGFGSVEGRRTGTLVDAALATKG